MIKKQACPMCGNSCDPVHKPFCSPRCKDRDLLNWLGESYRVVQDDDASERETGLDSGDRD
jgi:uncharacterized protein